ncbi:MAG: MutS-related protein, partial [Lachnospiraceae bacterium]
DFLSRGDNLNPEASWDGNYSVKAAPTNILEKIDEASGELDYFFFMGMLRPGVALLNKYERGGEVIRTLDRAMAAMLSSIVRKLKDVLSRHVQVSTHVISGLIPEFLFYIRWAEYVEKLQAAGFEVCRPRVLAADLRETRAEGLYNLHLAQQVLESKGNLQSEEIITNPLCFDKDHRVNLLTGANRGGKTTYTQAAGLSYLLAQGGIYAPAGSYAFSPVDNIFSHYPADENQTQDLGRLGEESRRFREIYMEATSHSLMLLNESFSTTSFEEGYYIATDAVKAMMKMGLRVIYNTHMHKLASDVDSFNADEEDNKAASLVAQADGSARTYKIAEMAPEGFSHARDIAEKYGVTFSQLIEGKEQESRKIDKG